MRDLFLYKSSIFLKQMPKFINLIYGNIINKKSISFRSHHTNGYEFLHLQENSLN